MKAWNAILVLIRLALGIIFILYGVLKLLGGQFIYGDFIFDSRTADGTTLVWFFYGYSPVYGRLIGVAEIIPGVLLLVPRTRTLGALILLPIAANIAVMDFCFNFPAVKYFALLLTLLDLVLLAADHRKLRLLLQVVLAEAPRLLPAVGDAPVARPNAVPHRHTVIKYTAAVVMALPVALFLVNLLLAGLSNPVDAATDYCIERGWPRHDLALLRWRMTSGWSGFDRRGEVVFSTKGKEPRKLLHLSVRRPHSFTGWRIEDYRATTEADESP